MARRLFLSIMGCVIAGSLLAVAPASAQDQSGVSADKAKAIRLFEQGARMFEAGEYQRACRLLEQSLELYPGTGTHGKLAECYERLGRYAEAWTLYRKVLDMATSAGNDSRERVAYERSLRLKELIGLIRLNTSNLDGTPGVIIKIDDVPVDPERPQGPHAVKPGIHRISIESTERGNWVYKVDLGQGQEKEIALPAMSIEQPESSGSGRRIAGIGLVAAGVISIGVGSYFGLQARSEYNAVINGDQCMEVNNENVCTDAGRDIVNGARTDADIATGLFSAGLAFATAGAWLWATSGSDSEASSEQLPAGWEITASPLGVGVRGSF